MADTVLDDALADFDIPADKLQAASLRNNAADGFAQASEENAASSSADAAPDGACSARDDSKPASKPFNPLPKRKEKGTSAAQPGSFNPLGKGNVRKKASAKNPAALLKPDSASEASSSSRPQLPKKQSVSQSAARGLAKDREVESELAQGMAQLMADLAKVRCSISHCPITHRRLSDRLMYPTSLMLENSAILRYTQSAFSMSMENITEHCQGISGKRHLPKQDHDDSAHVDCKVLQRWASNYHHCRSNCHCSAHTSWCCEAA